MIWKIRNTRLDLSRPRLMGILNLTPDSFSDGGKFSAPEEVLQTALTMVQDGADILDLGAESTRPGALPVPAAEEMRRLLPVLKLLRPQISVPISIDTTKLEVAGACLEAGADIINDVSGGHDSGGRIASDCRDYGAGLVLMHRRGNPGTMQSLARYGDMIEEIRRELDESIRLALKNGAAADQIVIDPGIGFAKTAEHSLEVIRRVEEFQTLGYPILLGASRKSFIGHVTGRETGEREFAHVAAAVYALMHGVSILRVHDVRGMRDVLKMFQAIQNAGAAEHEKTRT